MCLVIELLVQQAGSLFVPVPNLMVVVESWSIYHVHFMCVGDGGGGGKRFFLKCSFLEMWYNTQFLLLVLGVAQTLFIPFQMPKHVSVPPQLQLLQPFKFAIVLYSSFIDNFD